MVGNGNVFSNVATIQVLAAIGLEAGLTYTSNINDAAIYYIHKFADGEDLFFLPVTTFENLFESCTVFVGQGSRKYSTRYQVSYQSQRSALPQPDVP